MNEEARRSLEQILNSPNFYSLGILPRSKILEYRDHPPIAAPGSASPSSTKSPADQADDLLGNVKTVDDVSPALTLINAIPDQPMDLSGLRALEQVRYDAGAGLPITLDLAAAMTGNYMSDNISRITALELLAILPYYFDTEKTDPPKANETLGGYLDRLADAADAAGNLALLQRVVAVQTAITRGRSTTFGAPSAIFLAGLSQEAAGQYAPAVVTYEKSLQEYDSLEPVKLVGNRLRAIKAAHPDDYSQGMTTFLTSTPQIDPRFTGFPPGFVPGYQRFPTPPQLVPALPIPMNLSVPARPTTNAAPSDAVPPVAH